MNPKEFMMELCVICEIVIPIIVEQVKNKNNNNNGILQFNVMFYIYKIL